MRLADVEVARSAFLRAAYALPMLAVMVAVSGRASRRQRTGADADLRPSGEPGATRRRWWLPIAVAAGVLLGLDLVAWHATIGIIGAGLGTVLPNLQVVFVGIAGVALFGERPRRGFWWSLPLVLGGIAVLSVVGRPLAVDGSVLLGVFYGVLTALAYAAALVVLRLSRARSPDTAGVSVLWSLTLGAAVVTGLVAASQGVAAPAGWPADGWLLLLALGSQTAGWLLLTSSIHRLPAAATSVALLLQPVLALLWGWLLLGEPLGLPQLFGAAIVLTGVTVAHRAVARAPTPATEVMP